MSTPVINVVVTAPQPTTITPSFPVAGFTFDCVIIFLFLCFEFNVFVFLVNNKLKRNKNYIYSFTNL